MVFLIVELLKSLLPRTNISVYGLALLNLLLNNFDVFVIWDLKLLFSYRFLTVVISTLIFFTNMKVEIFFFKKAIFFNIFKSIISILTIACKIDEIVTFVYVPKFKSLRGVKSYGDLDW